MKRALVTGSNGFVGRHMVRELEARHWDVVGIDLPDDCRNLPTEYHVYDLIVHCAYHVGGRSAIDGSKRNLALNLQIDACMFDWAVQTKQQRFLYFSSSAAYPVFFQTKEMEKVALSEEYYSGCCSDADYGFAKVAGERLARNARGDMKVHVVRPFSGYGEDQVPDYPFRAFVERAKAKEFPFRVWGDKTSIRDWIHISDVVAGALAIVDADYQEPVNICTGIGTSMEDLAKLCMKAAGYDAPLLQGIEEVKGSPYGVHTRIGDPTLFHKFHSPKISIEEGVRRAFA